MLQWYQFDGWICTHRINPFYRGKVKLCKMCKIDYETIQEFLSFSFHYNNMDLLVDRAAEVLKNPIAVFDKNYYTVSYSDTTDVQDEVWTAGKKRGYCLFEYAAMLHGVESMRGTPLPFQIFDDWGPHRRRICPLISNSLTIGYLSVLEYHTAFDAVPGEIYDLVAGVLVKELTIEQAIRLSHQHDSAEMLLSSILNEGFANRALFLQRILGTVFEQAGPYSLIGINMHAFSSRVSGERHFRHVWERSFQRRGPCFSENMWSYWWSAEKAGKFRRTDCSSWRDTCQSMICAPVSVIHSQTCMRSGVTLIRLPWQKKWPGSPGVMPGSPNMMTTGFGGLLPRSPQNSGRTMSVLFCVI